MNRFEKSLAILGGSGEWQDGKYIVTQAPHMHRHLLGQAWAPDDNDAHSKILQFFYQMEIRSVGSYLLVDVTTGPLMVKMCKATGSDYQASWRRAVTDAFLAANA